MEISVDEALEAAKRDGGCDEDCVTPELAAEVERLQKENAHLRSQVNNGTLSSIAEADRLQKVVADQARTIGTLKDELAGTRSELETLYLDVTKEKTAAAWEQTKAKLQWFEEREDWMQERFDREILDVLVDWGAANPKPHDPDALDKHLAGGS